MTVDELEWRLAEKRRLIAMGEWAFFQDVYRRMKKKLPDREAWEVARQEVALKLVPKQRTRIGTIKLAIELLYGDELTADEKQDEINKLILRHEKGVVTSFIRKNRLKRLEERHRDKMMRELEDEGKLGKFLEAETQLRSEGIPPDDAAFQAYVSTKRAKKRSFWSR